MQRYLLNIAYIGTKYNGVTKNVNMKNHTSIQDIMEQAFDKTRSMRRVIIFPSSRTDAGVHATFSTLHIDLDRYLSPNYITKKLNTTLQAWNEQIRILKTIPVSNDFDSRTNAICRTYLYRIAVCKEKVPAGIKPKIFKNQMFIPIEESFRCQFVVNTDFEINRVREVAKMLEGIHDFRSFMKTSKEQRTFLTRFCWRSIESIEVRPGTTLATSFNAEKTLALYDFWDIEFKSKAYFYRQIRNMVATMLAAGNGKITIRDVYEMLTIPSKFSWLPPIKPVSASALYLTNVEYPPGAIPDCQENEPDVIQNTNLENEEDDENESLVKL